jgi:hypothetical protein
MKEQLFITKNEDATFNGQLSINELFNTNSALRVLKNVPLENTRWHGKVSKKSLSIKSKDTKKGEDLAHIFGLNADAFEKKYRQAISGDGQEERRIRTLHSSSLLCLLCFYGISEERPLYLNLEGRQISFTSSLFEEKNLVGIDEIGREHQSNMDVVLTGTDVQTDRKVILFLESKFSEYLKWGKYSGISNHVYWKTYAQLLDDGVLDRMGLKYEGCTEKPAYSDLTSIKGKTLHYAGGIKQMVSHFLGVKNAIARKHYEDYDIYLGEILFKFPDSIDEASQKYKDYDQMYKILAEGLNKLSEDRFKVLNQCLTYQEVFKTFDLDERVKSFYSL